MNWGTHTNAWHFLCQSFHRLLFTVSFCYSAKIESKTAKKKYVFFSPPIKEYKKECIEVIQFKIRLWVFHFGYWPKVFISIVWVSVLFNCTVIHIIQSLMSACVHIWMISCPFLFILWSALISVGFFFVISSYRIFSCRTYAQSNITTISIQCTNTRA